MQKTNIALSFENVIKSYVKTLVIKGVSFNIKENSLVSLVGLSGAGKTTILRSINRLEEIDSGDIKIYGESIYGKSLFDLRTSIGYVVQSAGLFPHMTIEQNLDIVRKIHLKREIKHIKGKIKKIKSAKLVDAKEQIEELQKQITHEKEKGFYSKIKFVEERDRLIKFCRLKKGLLEKRPGKLSGGQNQRFSIIRAFLTHANIILMDEPFSSLDPIVRRALQILTYKLKESFNKTIILVTHSPEEALALSDKVVVLKAGQIHFKGTSEEIKNTKLAYQFGWNP